MQVVPLHFFYRYIYTMKKLAGSLIILTFLISCGHRNSPDVSHITVDITLKRFDKYLFEKIDTNQILPGIVQMQKDYPFFAKDFMQYIIGVSPLSDSGFTLYPPLSALGNNDSLEIISRQFATFLRLTRPLYDSISPKFEKTDQLKQELTQAFKYVKYYFPSYRVPEIVTYIGPFDAPGVAVTQHALAIGLQLFAGNDFSFYNSTEGQNLYPQYISRRFEPQYITPNCMKAVIEDMFPDNSSGQAMVQQMVEKGKRWYLLDLFLPDTPDSLKTDYTQQQLKWCSTNEGQIWNFILKSNHLYAIEPEIIKDYIGESPHTDVLSDAAPGNIGQWVGWQIVRAYADKHPEITPEMLMKTDARKIFDEAKYKPR